MLLCVQCTSVMSEKPSRQKWTRRAVLLGAATGMSAAAAQALSEGGDSGTLYGGKMALEEAYNVGGDLWIGPDNVKSNVTAKSGRVFMASDTQVDYYGDGNSWVKMGVGSSSEPVPSITTESLVGVSEQIVQPTGGSGVGEDSPPASDPWTLDESILDGFQGRVIIPKGRWITNGLATDETLDWDSSPVYFDGGGVWVSQIEHADGSSPTIALQATEGNGGGVSNMTVYGAGENVGTANIVETNGSMIDTVFRNSIIRYGGGDALHIKASASGTRVVNCWLENVGGNALTLNQGTRPKVSMVHIISSDMGIRSKSVHIQASDLSINGTTQHGIYHTGDDSQWSNIYLDNNGDRALYQSGDSNTFSNITIKNGDGIHVYFSGQDSTLNGLSSKHSTFSAVSVVGSNHSVSDLSIVNWGSDSLFHYAVSVGGDNNTISGVSAEQQDTGTYSTPRALAVTGDNNLISGFQVHGTPDYEAVIQGTENVIHNLKGIDSTNVSDSGTRTLINGRGTNAGNPQSVGQWSGNASYAESQNAIIEDTTNNNLYMAINGSFVQI